MLSPRPVDSRLRGNDGKRLFCLVVAPCPLPSGLRIKSAMTEPSLHRPVDTALKPVRACATVVSSRYSAWRAHAALWFPAYAGMTGRSDGNVLLSPSLPCQALGQALVLGRQGRGDSVGLFGLLSPLCGYCLEASITEPTRPRYGFPPTRE